MIIVSRQNLNTHVRHLLSALADAKILHSFHTSVAVGPDHWLFDVLPDSLRDALDRRTISLSPSQTHCYPVRELIRYGAARLGWQGLIEESNAWACPFKVGREIDRKVSRYIRHYKSRPALTGIYSYQDAARMSFEAAKRRGVQTFYELPIAYWQTVRTLLIEECERYPDWVQTMEEIYDSDQKCENRTREIELADTIVCPSNFVLKSLPQHIRDTNRCVVARFGTDETIYPRERRSDIANRPLRVLFAGALSQRKGLADLLVAMNMLHRRDIELVVAGRPLKRIDFYRARSLHFKYQPVSTRAQLLDLMRNCDAFILPSLVEGRPFVVQDAMMCGLPIIVTPNVGCSDLVEEGVTGFIVPIRSPDLIAARLARLADNKSDIVDMARAAREAALRVTWRDYQTTLMREILASDSSAELAA